MELRCHSLLHGNHHYTGRMVPPRPGKAPLLYLEEPGRFVLPDEYIQDGYHVTEANRKEIEALVDAGYESRRLMLRFYDEMHKRTDEA